MGNIQNIFVFLFKDILENEDVKLDNMFIASLVADIIRVYYIYLRDSVISLIHE